MSDKKLKLAEDVIVNEKDKPDELFSPMKDLLPKETCDLLNKMCRE